MYIRDYVDTDLTHINHWLESRHLRMVTAEELPVTGSVYCSDGLPVAALFLRKCEGNLGILDSLITDPNQPGEIRNKANSLLILDLIEKAKALKLSALIAWTKDNNTFTRVLGLGFTPCDLSVISMDLKKEQVG